MGKRIEGLEVNRRSRNGARASEMDLVKFYVTLYISKFISNTANLNLNFLRYLALSPYENAVPH
jgi:hypothetical protein